MGGSSSPAARTSFDIAPVGAPTTDSSTPWAVSSSAPERSVGGLRSVGAGPVNAARASSSAPVPTSAGTASAAEPPREDIQR
ncbi:hypothetical protein GCM10017691_58600 [Pseudonocardia petroleophila]